MVDKRKLLVMANDEIAKSSVKIGNAILQLLEKDLPLDQKSVAVCTAIYTQSVLSAINVIAEYLETADSDPAQA